MSRRTRQELASLTPAENLGYLGDERLENLILTASLLTVAAVATGLLGLVGKVLWLAGLTAILAGVGVFFMMRLLREDQEQHRQWVKDTYGLNITPVELQQLREGKSIQRGSAWWLRDQSPWIIGFKLVKTEQASNLRP